MKGRGDPFLSRLQLELLSAAVLIMMFEVVNAMQRLGVEGGGGK